MYCNDSNVLYCILLYCTVLQMPQLSFFLKLNYSSFAKYCNGSAKYCCSCGSGSAKYDIRLLLIKKKRFKCIDTLYV